MPFTCEPARHIYGIGAPPCERNFDCRRTRLDYPQMETPLAARIDALLPQTQCTRCGYPTCRAYADAMAAGQTDINHCPPGGADGVAALAALLDRAPKPLDPANGIEAPVVGPVLGRVVRQKVAQPAGRERPFGAALG